MPIFLFGDKAAKHQEDINKLRANYSKLAAEITLLKASTVIQQEDKDDLDKLLAGYQRCIQKAVKAAEDHRIIVGTYKTFMANVKAKKAEKNVGSTVKDLSKQLEQEEKELKVKEEAAGQVVAARISEANETLRTSISAFRRSESSGPGPSIHSSWFSDISFETIDPSGW